MKYLKTFVTHNFNQNFKPGDIVVCIDKNKRYGNNKSMYGKEFIVDMTEFGRYIQLKNLRTNHIDTKFLDVKDYISEIGWCFDREELMKEMEDLEPYFSSNKYNL